MKFKSEKTSKISEVHAVFGYPFIEHFWLRDCKLKINRTDQHFKTEKMDNLKNLNLKYFQLDFDLRRWTILLTAEMNIADRWSGDQCETLDN